MVPRAVSYAKPIREPASSFFSHQGWPPVAASSPPSEAVRQASARIDRCVASPSPARLRARGLQLLMGALKAAFCRINTPIMARLFRAIFPKKHAHHGSAFSCHFSPSQLHDAVFPSSSCHLPPSQVHGAVFCLLRGGQRGTLLSIRGKRLWHLNGRTNWGIFRDLRRTRSRSGFSGTVVGSARAMVLMDLPQRQNCPFSPDWTDFPEIEPLSPDSVSR